jgi:hypothetical protein
MKLFSQAIAALAAVSIWAPACAETHALIMAISDYKIPGAAPLKGVVHDVASAQEIARRLGVKESNIVVRRDGELTLAGMERAFDELQARIAADDDVFIYYSGHGGRERVSDPSERCAESLISADGYGFLDSDLEVRLNELSRKANKLVVFLDACHSGGVTTRAKTDPRFASKYFSREGANACEVSVNVVQRGIVERGRTAGSGAQNYVYIAAARDNEVSLDESERGGVATQAWRECVSGAARDLDGSGAITAEEVRTCAQKLIDDKLQNVVGFTAHHISITGNARALLGMQPVREELPPAGVAVSPADTLKDIYAQRDDRRLVSLQMREPRPKIGRDRLEFTIRSSHAGYLYILMAGSDGKTFDVLFPNALDKKNEVAAGQSVQLPRASWQITAGGPAGTTHLLAMVTDAPRDFSKLGLKPAGPFSILEANAAAARDIQLVTGSSTSATAGSNGYGAVLIPLEEVQ